MVHLACPSDVPQSAASERLTQASLGRQESEKVHRLRKQKQPPPLTYRLFFLFWLKYEKLQMTTGAWWRQHRTTNCWSRTQNGFRAALQLIGLDGEERGRPVGLPHGRLHVMWPQRRRCDSAVRGGNMKAKSKSEQWKEEIQFGLSRKPLIGGIFQKQFPALLWFIKVSVFDENFTQNMELLAPQSFST